jgi:pimeloyl-ACP methyl ester carboxylesterase
VTADFDEFSLLADNASEVGLAWDGRPEIRRQRVSLPDGRSLSALVWGTGDPEVVLVHGGAQNAHTWDTVALALGRPLVAIDLPGHGHSDWKDSHDYTASANAPDVAAAIEALAPGARLLVGMSLGGLTSIAVTALRPDLVRQLMLVDITPGVNAEKSKAILDFVSGPTSFASFDEIFQRTLTHNPGRSEASLRRGVLHNAKELPDGTWSWRWDPTRTMGAGGDGAVRFAALWDDLSAVTVPVTLLRGGTSPVVDDNDVSELLRRLPDAEVVVVDGAGHSVQGDRPLEAARLIAARLDRS